MHFKLLLLFIAQFVTFAYAGPMKCFRFLCPLNYTDNMFGCASDCQAGYVPFGLWCRKKGSITLKLRHFVENIGTIVTDCEW